jgi:hypothetical protein
MNHLIAIYAIVAVFSFKFLLVYFQWNGDPIWNRGLLGAVVLPSLLWPIIAFYLAGYWVARLIALLILWLIIAFYLVGRLIALLILWLAAIVVKLLGW